MNYLNTKHKRKSAILTTIIMLLMLILMFIVGLNYIEPPEEYGIAINFGTSNVGSGTIQPDEKIKSEETEKIEEEIETEKVISEIKETSVKSSEKIITQDNEESIAIKKQLAEKKRLEDAKLEAERIEKAKKDAIEKKKREQEAKKKKLDALMGGLNKSEGEVTGGEGNDNVAGDKGSEVGDKNANGYYGNGGTGSGGDYQLGNRKPLSKPKPDYICDEEGLVVVNIEVDKSGKVIKATPGVKGSTNTADCLLTQAKKAALNTKWQPDSNAASKQYGIIKYRFTLSN